MLLDPSADLCARQLSFEVVLNPGMIPVSLAPLHHSLQGLCQLSRCESHSIFLLCCSVGFFSQLLFFSFSQSLTARSFSLTLCHEIDQGLTEWAVRLSQPRDCRKMVLARLCQQ